tara:strand:- start:238 stop:1593 length:1356 start_codon:yes stop_codon:yes gene_type:complete
MPKTYKSKYFEYTYDSTTITQNNYLSKQLIATIRDWYDHGYVKWNLSLYDIPSGIHIRYISNIDGIPKIRLGGTVTINDTTKRFILLKNLANNRGWSIQYTNIKQTDILGVYWNPEKSEQFLNKKIKQYLKSFPPAKILNPIQKYELIGEYYYNKGYNIGRDALYKIIKKYEDVNIVRKDVDNFLKNQVLYKLTKPCKRHCIIPGFIPKYPYKIIQLDYVSKPNITIFTAIDVFSRYGIARKVKKPSDVASIKGLDFVLKIFRQISNEDRPVRLILCDNDYAFYNDLFNKMTQKHKIKVLYGIPQNKSIIKRFNKHLLMLLQYHSQPNITQYTINNILKIYNQSENPITLYSPIDALSPKNKEIIFKNLNNNYNIDFDDTDDLHVGDKVYLRLQQPNNEKINNWSTEIFNIQQIIRSQKSPIQYRITNIKGKILNDNFYRSELKLLNSSHN